MNQNEAPTNKAPTSVGTISDPERRFLDRLSKKYSADPAKVSLRSYVIAAVVIVALFSLSRWIPWWWAAILTVEAVGLLLFHQYKRFGQFKTRLLIRLWRNQSDGNQP